MARGKLRLTEEVLKQQLHLPEEVHISDIQIDHNRGIIELHLRSSEPVRKLTFTSVEGQESLLGYYEIHNED